MIQPSVYAARIVACLSLPLRARQGDCRVRLQMERMRGCSILLDSAIAGEDGGPGQIGKRPAVS